MSRLRIGRCRVRKRLVGGLLILLVVDVLWVGSAGITRYLFKEESYEKPLFTTYFKTVLFSIYLVAFAFWRPWQRQCVWRRRRLSVGVTHEEDSESTHLLSAEQSAAPEMEKNEGGDCAVEGGDPGEGGCDVNEHTGQCEYYSLDGAEDSSAEALQLSGSPGEEGKPLLLSGSPGEGEGEEGRPLPLSGSPEEEGKPLPLSGCPGEGEGEEGRPLPLSGSPEEGGKPLLLLLQPDCHTYVHSEDVSQCGSGEAAGGRKLFRVPSKSASINTAVCPVFDPSMPVCLLGPPVVERLHYCESEDSDTEPAWTNKPLPACQRRCCKVKFKPTVEVRETIGEDHCVLPRQRCPLRKVGQKLRPPPSQPLPVYKVALLALVFGFLWFFANYLYALALDRSSVAAVNTLSAVSGVFVMLLAAVPLLHTTDADRFTLSRLLVTLVSMGGAVMVGLSPSSSDEDTHHITFSTGAILAVGGAILYALYLVLLRKVVGDHDALEIPMFFGFVGLFCAVLLLPLVAIWNAAGIELFLLPPTNSVWTLLLVNGFVGTVLSELLWLWAVFLTSPLLGTLALSLVTPLSITYSIAFGEATFSWLFLVGAALILLSFVGVAILEHYGAWDPLWVGLKTFFVKAKDISVHRGFHSLSSESQRLVTSRPPPMCTNDYVIT